MKRPRSALYVPGDNLRAIAKARTLGADMLILDLEDGVAPEHKARARENICAALREGFECPVLVRLNSSGTVWEQDDQEAVLCEKPDGLVLPKVEEAGVPRSMTLGLPLWLMIETPRGVLAAPDLAAEQGVAGLIVGANDLAHALRARPSADRTPLLHALSAVVLAARAHGKFVLDAVYNDIHDAEGFERECLQGRDLGFDGKTVIHPSQVAVAQRAYGVSEAQVQAARELLSAWEAGRAEGKSLITLHGQMVEAMHVEEARAVLLEAGA
ncbi:HpcH/HpaI aldolase/citrate lyase family protein [Deinococcus alpinitundrae]|uniref:HpcH/HpaI aldolase/citrate lyase family protein n=1 Tax=Deinococcus alpinitundrae TaxID=468913 RepID=UPI00137A2149|nr:CoA ester lyase [Deinococcus alpinitundrae]